MLNLSSEVFRKGLTADPSTSDCGRHSKLYLMFGYSLEILNII
jgi:hypothetical protein